MQKWRLLLILSAVSWAHSIAAQDRDIQGPVSFSQARKLILSQNAGLKSANTETEAAKTKIEQADAIPNPIVGVALDRLGTNEIEAYIEQTIELGLKRKLRRNAAKKELDAVINAQELTMLELETEIIRRFIPVSVSSQKILLLDSMIEISALAKKQIQIRVEAGAAKKTDLIRAEIDIDQLKLERGELVRESLQARNKFAALGGEQGSAILNVSGSISEEVEIPSVDALRNALAGNPQLKAVDIEQERLATQQKQLRAEVVPDLNLTAGYLRNNNDNSHSPLVGLSMSIPLFNKNTAAQKQIELQRQAAGERRENTLRLLDADIQDLHSRLLEIDNKISTLKTNVIPKAEQVYLMVHDYYSAGSAGFLDLMDAQTEMLKLRMTLLDIQAERAQKLVDLMQITSLTLQIVK